MRRRNILHTKIYRKNYIYKKKYEGLKHKIENERLKSEEVKCRKFSNLSISDKTNIITSLFTMITVFISVGSLIYSINKDHEGELERVNTQLATIVTEHAPEYTEELGHSGKKSKIAMKYKVIISNNSKKSISLVSMNVAETVDNSPQVNSDMVKNIYFEEDEEKKFPISLEAGESTVMNIELNYFISKEVDKIIQSKYYYGQRIVYTQLQDYLMDNNIDIYGNKYETILNNKSYDKDNIEDTYDSYKYKKVIGELKYPIYLLTLETSTGKHFKEILDSSYIYRFDTSDKSN